MKNTKSPLKEKLLRTPGQSLDEEINKIIDDQALTYLLAPIFFIILAIMEWYKWYMAVPPSPWTMTIMALIVAVFSVYKIVPLRKKLVALRQGRDGEKAVAEMLNFYREAKMKVFHDIVGENFNIDHVVVSTRGVFLVETKTYSKPMKGKTEITFNGQTIIKNGYRFNDDILIQVKGSSKWLRDLIEELTAKEVEVQPAVVFPGWYVRMTNEYKSDIWMLNPRNLDKFIMGKKEILTDEDVKLISNHLSRYIRSTQE
ncbi:nuclease-related domain-containing protein [Sulfurimonas sp. HSL3-7]|uniref:nuclease-related domain-containing protein n=1 Tax=Sulfonitrofixus jiaomeiensis TaxID=3131938 RepID=UPI0031F7984C